MILVGSPGKTTEVDYKCGCLRILMDECPSALLVKNTEYLKP